MTRMPYPLGIRGTIDGAERCANTPRPLTPVRHYRTEGFMKPTRICAVDDCDREIWCRGWCSVHYQRWRRHGDPLTLVNMTGDGCSVADCDRPYYGRGFCELHHRRLRLHGDPAIVLPGNTAAGVANTSWMGDRLGYAAAHSRVYAAFGVASGHTCQHCGVQAEHWAYDHSDPDELADENGWKYSADPTHYVSLCAPCHRRFDADARAGVV